MIVIFACQALDLCQQFFSAQEVKKHGRLDKSKSEKVELWERAAKMCGCRGRGAFRVVEEQKQTVTCRRSNL
eukprot:25653-Rhodomonas_salina.2